jgi:uncharacterized protein
LALSAYADASPLVALFTPDAFSDRADIFVRDQRPVILVSDFAAAEFASALAKRVRTREISTDEAREAFLAFDAWARFRGARLETTSSDVAAAERILRRLELNLRAPDAINIAIADRYGAALATFDIRMADAATALGVELAPT